MDMLNEMENQGEGGTKLNKNQQIVYYRSAKTASTSILSALDKSSCRVIKLTPQYPALENCRLAKFDVVVVGVACNPNTEGFLRVQKCISNLSSHTSFAVVRNPYSKFLSGLNYCQIPKSDLQDIYSGKWDKFSQHTKVHLLRSQKDALYLEGHRYAENIFKFENLDQVPKFFKQHGFDLSLGHENKTKRKIHSMDDRMRDFVSETYREDFELFGYKML